MPSKQKPKSKSTNKKTQASTRSGFERKVWDNLEQRGITFFYEAEKIPYEVPATTRNYILDFKVVTPSGNTVRCEVKGRLTRQDRTKMLNVKKSNPELDLRFLFQRDQAISKGAKMKYSDWCIKHGFAYAISGAGELPSTWLK